MIKRYLTLALSAGAALAIWAAPAAEFWDTKQPSEWSEKDVQRLQSKSPWAKEAAIEMDFSAMGDRGFDGGGMGGPPDMGGRGPGGFGGFGGQSAVIRWENAEPLRAIAKNKLPGEANSSYVISVSGLSMIGDLGATLGESGVETLKKGTSLQRSGKKPIFPSSITMPFDQAGVILFYFPKDDPIGADEKQDVFQTKIQMFALKAKFLPKEMSYKGKPAI